MYVPYHQNNTLVVPLDAGVHEGGRPKVPKAADYEKRADGCHAPSKPLRQVDVARHNASRNEQIERGHVADGIQSLREQLKVLVCALVMERTAVDHVSSDKRAIERIGVCKLH